MNEITVASRDKMILGQCHCEVKNRLSARIFLFPRDPYFPYQLHDLLYYSYDNIRFDYEHPSYL